MMWEDDWGGQRLDRDVDKEVSIIWARDDERDWSLGPNRDIIFVQKDTDKTECLRILLSDRVVGKWDGDWTEENYKKWRRWGIVGCSIIPVSIILTVLIAWACN